MSKALLTSLFSLALACISAPLAVGQAPQGDQTMPTRPVDAILRNLNDPKGGVMVAAHRGCWNPEPENSLAAIDNCIARGVDIVETDLRLTKDGRLVILHDSSIDRMTDGHGKIADLTLAQIKAAHLRAGDGGPSHAVTRERVPTFDELAARAKGKILLILDIKDKDFRRCSDAAAEVLRGLGMEGETLVAVVGSHDEIAPQAGSLLETTRFLPNLRTEQGALSKVAPTFKDLNPIAVAVRFEDWSYLSEGFKSVAAMPARLWVNTLDPVHAAGLTDADAMKDPDKLWGRLLENGVNMIQTDEPEALLAYLKKKGRR